MFQRKRRALRNVAPPQWRRDPLPPDLRAARGILLGVAVGCALWALLGFVLYVAVKLIY